MAFRYGSRNQIALFTQCLEDSISEDDPVRLYNAFIEALDKKELYLDLDEKKVGNKNYDPISMLKLLSYGTSYGIFSSRKLERALHHNVSFMWLMGGLKPDHKTISLFRKNNRKALKSILKQCAKICLKLGFIEGNTLFLDGSKMRGNASIKNTWNKKRSDKRLEFLNKRIDEVLNQCDQIDEQESGLGSFSKLSSELKNMHKEKKKIKGILEELSKEEKKSINSTDKDSINFKSREGSHTGYNIQCVTDKKNGLIINVDPVSESNDRNQFSKQINQACEVLNKNCKEAIADTGYDNIEELSKIHNKGIDVIVPFQKQGSQTDGDFDKNNFHYDKENDQYICPKGEVLKYSSFARVKNSKFYRINSRVICKNCEYFGKCTKCSKGRTISRLLKEELKNKLIEKYNTKESKELYKFRQHIAEAPFGFIKNNLKFRQFLLKGRDSVQAEISLVANAFNLTKLMNKIGVPGLIEKLAIV